MCDVSFDVVLCDLFECVDVVDDVVCILCDGEVEMLVNDLNVFGGVYVLCRCVE